MGEHILPSGMIVCFVDSKFQFNREDAQAFCLGLGYDGLLEGRTAEDRTAISRLEFCE